MRKKKPSRVSQKAKGIKNGVGAPKEMRGLAPLSVASVRRSAEMDAYARLRIAHSFGAVYRLAPKDSQTEPVGGASVKVISGLDAEREGTIGKVLRLIDAGLWSGSSDVRAEHQWAHVLDERSGISRGYLRSRLQEAIDDSEITAVVVSNNDGPTALVLMRLHMGEEHIETEDNKGEITHFDERWAPNLAYIGILSKRDGAPGGHPAFAMASAMEVASRAGKRIVYLSAIPVVVGYYLDNSFGRRVHAFLLGDKETFERSREYALSPPSSARDFANIEDAILHATHQADYPIVGFVLDGKDALSGLDYRKLVAGQPPTSESEWLGRHVAMWPVDSATPLVVGRTYDVVHAKGKSVLSRAGDLTGYLAPSGGLVGRRRLAGAFVGVKGRRDTKREGSEVAAWSEGEVLTFSNGILGCYVEIAYDRRIGFRQTTREHDLIGHEIDGVAEVKTVLVSELPEAESLGPA